MFNMQESAENRVSLFILESNMRKIMVFDERNYKVFQRKKHSELSI